MMTTETTMTMPAMTTISRWAGAEDINVGGGKLPAAVIPTRAAKKPRTSRSPWWLRVLAGL